MTTLEQTDLSGCLKWTFKLITLSGYWFPRKGNKSAILLYTAYSFVFFGCCLVGFAILELIYMIQVFGQMDEMINTMFVLFTHTTQTIKVIVFIYRKEEIYDLLDCLNEKIFKPKNATQKQRVILIVNYTNKLAKFYLFLVSLTVCFFGIFPLLDNSTARQLPARIWFPIDFRVSPIYEILFVYQIFSGMISACSNAAVDTIIVAFISQISIQLDILCDSLYHTKQFALEKLKQKKKSLTDDEVEKEMKKFLKECTKHHVKLIK